MTDNLTNLIWLQNSDCFGERDWMTALNDANTLASGSCGLTDGSVAGDWRLPNVRELYSLIDYGSASPLALPDGHPFSGPGGRRWTSTSRYENPIGALSIDIGSGWMDTTQLKTWTFRVWPVRSGFDDCSAGGLCGVPKTGQTQCWDEAATELPCAGTGQDGELQIGIESPDPRFTDHGDGTVTDELTGLTWLKQADCTTEIWLDALSFVSNLADGTCGLTDGSAAGDWRLPNVRELFTLTDHGQDPALPAGHPFTYDLPFGWYSFYSSTSRGGNQVWSVVFSLGYIHSLEKTSGGTPVWAVKGGICELATDIPEIRLSKPNVTDLAVSWDAFAGVDSWDVIGGSLTDLLGANGNFIPATDECLADNQAGTTYQQATSEGGDADWFLVRASSCGQNGTVNSNGPHQTGLRDFGVNFAGVCD